MKIVGELCSPKPGSTKDSCEPAESGRQAWNGCSLTFLMKETPLDLRALRCRTVSGKHTG